MMGIEGKAGAGAGIERRVRGRFFEYNGYNKGLLSGINGF
jgi:hypothetical protein